jgi:hypothetical protein
VFERIGCPQAAIRILSQYDRSQSEQYTDQKGKLDCPAQMRPGGRRRRDRGLEDRGVAALCRSGGLVLVKLLD